jgi:hypothetical protein
MQETANRQSPETSKVKICFDVAPNHAPALRSAVEEIRNEVGGRLEGQHRYAKQDALTYAAVALGSLFAAITRKVTAGDPGYSA